MTRARSLDRITLDVPTHSGSRDAITMTEMAISTIALPEGHFTAIVMSQPGVRHAVMAVLDHDEVEAQIMFLRNSVEDAKLLDAGKQPIHAAPSFVRN